MMMYPKYFNFRFLIYNISIIVQILLLSFHEILFYETQWNIIELFTYEMQWNISELFAYEMQS